MLIPRQFPLARLLLAALCLAPLTGCVERKITIGSDPEGAVVTLNDEEIGRTPITVPFIWYGDYDVVLRYEKNVGTPQKPEIRRYYLHTHRYTKTPVFEIIPIDLVAQLLPIKFVDHQIWAFPVPEVHEPADDVVIQRARDLKAELDAPEPLQNKKKPKTPAPPATTAPATAPHG
jgi:PEGA domain